MFRSSSGKRKTSEDPPLEEEDRRPQKRAFWYRSTSEGNVASDSDLLTLLDLTSTSSETEIHERFDKIAEYLLSGRFHLVIRRRPEEEVCYELLEVEFYLWKSGCHEDPFTHGSEEQRISGQWYFHRAPKFSVDASRSKTSTSVYRGGTRKGLDLTLGGSPVESLKLTSPTVNATSSSRSNFTNSDSSSARKVLEPASSPIPAIEVRGGILLRSMRRYDDGKVISGPSLLVDEILKQNTHTPGSETLSISELVDHEWGGDISAFPFLVKHSESSSAPTVQRSPIMFLRAVKSIGKAPPIYRSPRIGLELSHSGTMAVPSHPRVIYLGRRYRYFVHPNLLTANGRVQTFLGILHDVISKSSSANTTVGGPGPGTSKRARIQTVSKTRISQLTGLKATSVGNYLTYYLDGYDRGELKIFVGAAGKGASSSPGTYLRMMGTIAKIIDGA